MKKLASLSIFILVLSLALMGCVGMGAVEIVDLGGCMTEIEVRNTALLGANSVTHINNDFIMTLNADRHTYSTTDVISIWGTLEYVGDSECILIWHGCPFMIFYISGGDFGDGFGGFRSLVSFSNVLNRGRAYHFDFQKSGVWSADDPNADFFEGLFAAEELILPAGNYTITLVGDFRLSERVMDSKSGLMAELNITVTQ